MSYIQLDEGTMAGASSESREPTSAEKLQAVTVGKLQPLKGPIQLCEYDENWPTLFTREAERIRRALGGAALRIEHIGSTSVPDLIAKPIIDIVMEVADSRVEPAYLPPLEAQGYVLRIREPEWWEHRMLKGPDTDINLHVFSARCAEVARMLRFRDHLRADSTDRELYATAKRDLAARHWEFVQHYADAKTAVVEEIMARANRLRD